MNERDDPLVDRLVADLQPIRPQRARTPAATAGQRFALVSGPRTTLESFEYYETDVAVVEPGYPAGSHYWLTSDCAIPSK